MKLLSQGWRCSSRLLSRPQALESAICITPEQSFGNLERTVPFRGARVPASGHCDVTRFASSRFCGFPVSGSPRDLPASRALSPYSSWLEALSREDSEMAPDVSTPSEGHAGEGVASYPHRGFQIVVAATRSMGIGKHGQLPWKLPTDMKFFKSVTSATSSPLKKNAVIMGRVTWESIPEKFRPLPGRLNVILTRRGIKWDRPGVVVSESLDAALALLATPPYSSEVETVFVIGGGQVYKYATNCCKNLGQLIRNSVASAPRELTCGFFALVMVQGSHGLTVVQGGSSHRG